MSNVMQTEAGGGGKESSSWRGQRRKSPRSKVVRAEVSRRLCIQPKDNVIIEIL